MSFKRALLVAGTVGISTFGAALEVQFYDEDLPSTLNPLYAETMVDYRAQELAFDRLYYIDPIRNSLQSRVVRKWELASESSVRLFLNEGLKWQNGEAITGEDVCFTINAMLDKKTPSKQAKIFREFFKKCTIESPLQVKIDYTKVFYRPISKLNFVLLPKSSFSTTAISPKDEFAKRPNGSGAYKGSRGTRAATFTSHVSSAHRTPTIDKFKLFKASDPRVQVETVMNGQIHGIVSVAPQYRSKLFNSSEVSLMTYDLRSWWFIALNTQNPALANKDVRTALNYVLDRSDLREKALGVVKNEDSPCEFISGPFVPASPYYNRTVPVVEYKNMGKARALLKRAGLTQKGGNWHYKDKPIVIKIGMKETLRKEAPDLLEQIGNQLQAAGFDRLTYKITADEWSTQIVTGKGTKDYDMVIGKWSFNIDEDVNEIFQTRTQYQGSRNIFNYSNSEVDSILKEFDAARSVDAAKNAYHQLHKALAADLPYLFLWKLDTKSAWRQEVRENIISPYYYFTVVDQWKYSSK